MVKDKNVSIKISPEMYASLQKLRYTLKQQDDSKAIRFCITYTLASIDRLDETKITEALAIAFSESMFQG